MPLIATNQWLQSYLEGKHGSMEEDIGLHRDILCEKLTAYFPGTTVHEIHHHLLQNGLFLPGDSDQKVIEEMCRKNFWENVEDELNQLKVKWNGPEVPVFIFPCNMEIEELRVDFKGRSGLAYQDKIFLFISDHTSKAELRALITHEYNHVCRLTFLNKQERNIVLLDSLVLEGLAEMAVYERVGEDYLAKWASIYSEKDALLNWDKWIKPNVDMKKSNFRHRQLMYGDHSIPKWLGYNIGFHIVASYVKKTKSKMDDMLQVPSEVIFNDSAFAK